MKRISKAVLLGGLAFTLAIGVAPAQQINEIIRGAANGIGSDMFGCGNGNSACNLGYRMYCDLDPSDTSGAANPIDGIPSYRKQASRYLTDAQITGNFPVCGNAGPGNNWYMLFDGQTGPGTAAHAGWYGGQAQILNFNEIGNSLSFNCLPVIAAEACFAALDERTTFNDTTLSDGSPLNHVGGLSPVPVVQWDSSLVDGSITVSWEQAVNQTNRDGASPAIAGMNVYWLPGDSSATDADWAADGALLASLPSDATSLVFQRGDVVPSDRSFFLATKVAYAGGPESFPSANSILFDGTLGLDLAALEGGDAPAVVDVELIGLGVRADDFGKEFLLILVDIVGSPEGKVKTPDISFLVNINSPGAIRNNRQIRARALNGFPVNLRFNTNFDNTGEPDRLLTENTTFYDDQGQILFGVPLAELAESLGGGAINNPVGSRVILLNGRVAVPGAQDQWPNGGGDISFTF